MTLAAVAGAGALGAVARYLFDGLVQQRVDGVFPWGTFAVNVSGSFAAGIVAGLALSQDFGGTPRTVVAVGFCGAYTTFSTLTYETIRLIEDGAWLTGLTNLVLSLLAGLVAAGLGLSVAGGW